MLDGMRAVAACLVVIHHLAVGPLAKSLRELGYPFLANLIGGVTSSGVELFFVLSGIVLARPYVRDARPFIISTYVARRVMRLMPPYLCAWMLAGVAIFLATKFPTWWTVGAGLPTFSLGEWLKQVGIVYFGPINYNFAWWSLTVEVAFYCLLPLLIPIFARLSISGLWISFSIGVLISMFSGFLLLSPPLVHHLTQYASCFCAGLLLARKIPGTRVRTCLVSLGIFLVLLACQRPQINPHVGWGLIYFGLVATVLAAESPACRCLSTHGLVWLGERSYSLFLVNFSIIGLVCHAASFVFDSKTIGYFVVTRFASIALSLVAAGLVFHFVERRFARGLATAGEFWPRRS